MSKIHFVIGVIAIAVLVVVGIATAMIKVVEGVMIMIVLAIASPFILRFIRSTRKHDER